MSDTRVTSSKGCEEENAAQANPEDGGAEAAATEEATDGAVVEQEVDPLESARREAVDYKDRWMRSAAEFDNYRKRTQREMGALLETASEGVIRELLPILDGIERALSHRKEGGSDSDGYRAGVEMLMEQLPRVLQGRGLTEIEAKGHPFDPSEQEALLEMPSNDVKAGHVCEVVEKGYRLGQKVIRPAKVVVSRGPVESNGKAEGAPAEGASSEEERRSAP